MKRKRTAKVSGESFLQGGPRLKVRAQYRQIFMKLITQCEATGLSGRHATRSLSDYRTR